MATWHEDDTILTTSSNILTLRNNRLHLSTLRTMPRTRTKGSILPKSILDAATKLFIERGFDGTSMYHIADALGVTRTAVYYYFKNKEAILAALTEGVTRVAGQIAEQLADHKYLEPVAALRKLVVQHT